MNITRKAHVPSLDAHAALMQEAIADSFIAKPTYQDWVRAIRERDEKQAVTKRKTRRSGY